MTVKKARLGKGLNALLNSAQFSTDELLNKENTPVKQKKIKNDDLKEMDKLNTTITIDNEKMTLKKLSTELLHPGIYQPRKDMSRENLEELASSIKKQGIIQPIIVRQTDNNKYEIIAGERRWRASQIAGLTEVPCLIKNMNDRAAIAIALIENIQREDLNVMEEAIALQRLIDEFQLTHAEAAEAVGKSRTTITNLLRLNALNNEVKKFVEHGELEMGHARALLSLKLEQQTVAARYIIAKELTVRETEKYVNDLLYPKKHLKYKLDPDLHQLIEKLTYQLGAEVAIKHNRLGKGKIVVNYSSLDELDGILENILKKESVDF